MKRRAFINYQAASRRRRIERAQFAAAPVETGVAVTPPGGTTFVVGLRVYNDGSYELSRDNTIEFVGKIA